ncbi:MAG: tetratricopeptide repeat protein [Pseudomonadota bacterium]
MSDQEPTQRTVSLGEAMEVVRAALQNGAIDDAGDILEQIVAAKPDFADGINYLAGVRYAQRRIPEAIELTHKAAQLAPTNASIWTNLATLYLETDEADKAIAMYHEAHHLDPTHPDPLIHLGRMLCAYGRHKEAEPLLKRAVELAPDSEFGHIEYADLLLALGRNQEAMDHGYRALQNNPRAQKSVPLILRAKLRWDGAEAAKAFLEELLEKDPDHSEARHLLGALDGDLMPDRATDDYVKATFDSFSKSFDEKLQSLEYRAPDLIGDELDKMQEGQPEGRLSLLDAGCGTGWSGERLRKHAATMIGIDLSAGMLAKAKQRGIYDELHEVELVSFLEQNPAAYDGVISADTLCYFGRLDGYCKAAHAALRPGGFTIFTVEKMPEDVSQDYRMHESGRYQHSTAYVRREMERAGFEMLAANDMVLRQEAMENVGGLVCIGKAI